MKRILLLGHTGKMGIAFTEALKEGYELVGKNSKEFDASDFTQVREIISETRPDIVINTVAMLGITPCEKDPENAMVLNTLYPKLLAGLSNEFSFLLVHLSSAAIFDGAKDGFYTELDVPKPVNIYGLTKYGGDCLVESIAERYYIFRLPVLFGRSVKKTQFVEKMLSKMIDRDEDIRVAGDMISSPSYSLDIAASVKTFLDSSIEYGVYHLANEGQASLFEFISELSGCLGLDIRIEKASYRDFPSQGMVNVNSAIVSKKRGSLRPWKTALRDYADELKKEGVCG
ncbi:SDR family oxidoreductase [Nanoarchaeota archaeon]